MGVRLFSGALSSHQSRTRTPKAELQRPSLATCAPKCKLVGRAETRTHVLAQPALASLSWLIAARRSNLGRPGRAHLNMPGVAAEAGAPPLSQAKPANATLAAVGLAYLLSTCLNRMLFRVVLVPMGGSTHILAVTTNLVYLAYFWNNCRRRQTACAQLPAAWDFVCRGGGKWLLLGSGLAQAVAFTVMPLFARRLPGSTVTVIGQSMLPFSMLLSAVCLGRRYDRLQCGGVGVVVLGIAVCTYPQVVAEAAAGELGGAVAAGAPFLLSALGLVAGYFFNSASFVFKESAVLRYAEEHPSERLNGDVANLITSVWQGVALWFLWPFNFAFLTPLSPAEYFKAAWEIAAQPQTGILLLAYWCLNVFYVSITLTAITCLSSVVVLLLSTLSVPLVALLFCIRLPLLGAAPFSWYSLAGVVIICAGVLTFNHQQLHSWRKL
mmetsp:Transcript_96410/g.267854  ORF Transcript_96410/g.267854 Transcript_96410/m.267854 type:complete len:438 (-) Transcript_96410:136-1449(-)